MTASDILTAHLPITSRNVGEVAAEIEAYLQDNAPRIMAQKTSPAKQDASRRNGLHGGKPRKYELQPGDVVMLRKSVYASRHDEKAAVVEIQENGTVHLDSMLDGWYLRWHTSELKRAKRTPRKDGEPNKNGVVQRTK